MPVATGAKPSFFVRHEFLLRRLHSLSGLVPVGVFLCMHLSTNASVVAGPEMFQRNVDLIHAAGPLVPLLEWVFIFLPLLFHGLFGFVIVATGVSNTWNYPYPNNYRYYLQRVTGVIAFFFILFHVLHMHHYGELLLGSGGGTFQWGQFDPERATSSASMALQPLWLQALYAIGVLASVYHLANGIWTMGITWGVWVSPRAQRRADYVCLGFGVLLALIGLSGLAGMVNADRVRAQAYETAREQERKEFEERVHADPAAVAPTTKETKKQGSQGAE